mgnify:CR=1 FL=1
MNTDDKGKHTWLWGCIASFFALTSVAMGAFAAHGLKHTMDTYQLDIMAKAAQYQMYHALAMLVISAILLILSVNSVEQKISQFKHMLHQANVLYTVGTILFSGSLYALAFSQMKIFAYLTPLGGFSFLLAWFWLMFAFFKLR